MFRIIYPFVLIIALLVTGCASSPTNTPINIPAATPALPVITDEWTVKMTHSGGIMGLMRSIEISSDGSYTVTDDRTKKEITGKLTGSELTKLSGVVTSAKLVPSDMPGVSACADCFIYDIEIRSGEQKLAAQLDDISLPNSGMEDLVTSLRELMDSALK
jgi:hypothetical protein